MWDIHGNVKFLAQRTTGTRYKPVHMIRENRLESFGFSMNLGEV